MNLQRDDVSGADFTATFLGLCLFVITLVYLQKLTTEKKRNSWQYWYGLVGELQPRQEKLSKSQRRDNNIKKKRFKKRIESEQRRIGQC